MRQSAVIFKSKGVNLEGVVASPDELAGPFPGAVVCHPHPAFGGDMNNGVVLALCEALVKEGCATLRFNFRGVGNSEGSFSLGEEEHNDVGAALGLLRHWPGVNGKRVGLAGYSFGASMVLASMKGLRHARVFVLISPPVNSLKPLESGRDKRPKLIIVGDMDRLSPHTTLKEAIEPLVDPIDFKVVAGADHSWRGHEVEAAQQATRFLVDALLK